MQYRFLTLWEPDRFQTHAYALLSVDNLSGLSNVRDSIGYLESPNRIAAANTEAITITTGYPARPDQLIVIFADSNEYLFSELDLRILVTLCSNEYLFRNSTCESSPQDSGSDHAELFLEETVLCDITSKEQTAAPKC